MAMIGALLNRPGGTPVRGHGTGKCSSVIQTPWGVFLQLQTLRGASAFLLMQTPVRGHCTGKYSLVIQTPWGVFVQLQTLRGASAVF